MSGAGLRIAVDALSTAVANGEPRTLTASSLEVATMDRTRPRRKFRRLPVQQLEQLLG